MRIIVLFVAVAFIGLGSCLAQRALGPSAIYQIRQVSDPEVSPDKKWIGYVVSTADSTEDKNSENVWMTAVDGTGSVQLTFGDEDESNPKWSPDNKWLSFLSSRGKPKDKSQIWLLDRRGGEAKQLTKLKASISDYAWSPDSKKLLLVIRDQVVRPDSMKDKPAKPIVIDRYHFKSDGAGYLENRFAHLYLFDLETKKMDTLTRGNFNHADPAWSPDGKHIAFSSNRTSDADRNTNSDVWIIEAKKGAVARQLTTWVDYDRAPVWSADGKFISYLRSVSAENDMYDEPLLAVIPVSGGEPKLVSKSLDRPVNQPVLAADGKSILALIEDDRRRYVMSFDTGAGTWRKISSGDRSVTVVKPLDATRYVVLMSEPSRPSEIYLMQNEQFKKLTTHNDDFVSNHRFATVEGFSFKTDENITVGGLLLWPPGKPRDKKLPLILWIHGGPVAQDEFEFDLTPQVLAAQGYAVACINYRGSNGRGYDFARAIFGDWGHFEVIDLLAGVDYLIKSGAADPDHLGIGGWSYGGILTDYITASDSRFKAAASGAGSALQITMYGTDQYVQQYEMELGVPWKNMDKWMKVSYPFWKVENIKTPTLYMVGENDFNVPAAGSEQMYQALRSLGIPTQLIIYPGQHHGLTVPSYWKDRFDRYIKWYGKYLKN
ncbi:MAG TPA: S9 family peptidase [Chryseolinea sp.]|nr:S9 family peptidase [Chryseolinea sp.]